MVLDNVISWHFTNWMLSANPLQMNYVLNKRHQDEKVYGEVLLKPDIG